MSGLGGVGSIYLSNAMDRRGKMAKLKKSARSEAEAGVQSPGEHYTDLLHKGRGSVAT